MQLESAEELIQALRASGLFTSEQLAVVSRDIAAHAPDLHAGLRYLIKRARVTHYQLGKVVRGKSADLFVGPYVVLDKLGEGGMGKVFRARHTRLDRVVALKVIRPSLVSNPTVRGRYAREVEATGKLDHPNIVRVDDAGEADGKFYLAMEFVDGIDLARMMRDYKVLEITEACEYVRQAALGLHHAHAAGIVHRDVKPSNIVVSGERHLPQATEPAVVKILDLGLARAIDPDDMVVPDLTRDYTVVGTPDYMAPEQAKNSRLVDGRADLYSLGCTLYYLLAGQPPFPSGNAIEKLMRHQTEAPAPIQQFRLEVTAALAEIVARLLAKKPGDRFATGDELAAALEPHARYPDGSVAVPVVLVREHERGAMPGTASAPGYGTSIGSGSRLNVPPDPVPPAQPVAPSDHTPRPHGRPDVLPVIEPRDAPASAVRHPPVKRSPARPAPAESAKPDALKWVLVAVALAILVALAVWAATLGPTPAPPKPAPDTGTKPAPVVPPTPPRPGVGIVPAVNFGRLHTLSALVPDGTGTVVVAYPSAYFRDNDSPFTKGSGPGKLSHFAARLQTDTELNLPHSERAVLGLTVANAHHYVLASEGPYLGSKFATDLDKHARLTPYRPGAKAARPFKAYAAGGERATALFQPPPQFPNAAPVYFAMNGRDTVERAALRLVIGSWRTNPDLEPGVLPALNAAAEPPLPLLVLVASGRQKLPLLGEPTVKQLGADLIVAVLRIGDRAEIDVTVHAGSNADARAFVQVLADRYRDEYPFSSRAFVAALTRALADAPADVNPLVLKVRWTPEQWSAFLDQILA